MKKIKDSIDDNLIFDKYSLHVTHHLSLYSWAKGISFSLKLISQSLSMKTLKYLTNIFLDSFCGFSKKGKDRMRVLKILASFSDNGSIVVVRKYLILLYSARHLKKKILKNLNK